MSYSRSWSRLGRTLYNDPEVEMEFEKQRKLRRENNKIRKNFLFSLSNLLPDNVCRPAKRSSSSISGNKTNERSEIGGGKTKIAKPRDEHFFPMPMMVSQILMTVSLILPMMVSQILMTLSLIWMGTRLPKNRNQAGRPIQQQSPIQ